MTKPKFYITERLKAKINDAFQGPDFKELRERAANDDAELEQLIRESINFRITATDIIKTFENGTEQLLLKSAMIAQARIDCLHYYRKCLHAYKTGKQIK